MTPYERAIVEARRALLGIEQRAARALVGSYAVVADRLAGNAQALADEIERARAAGTVIRPAWLARQATYRQMLDELAGDVAEFAGAAASRIAVAQRDAGQLAEGHAEDLAVEALGPGPDAAQQAVRGRFHPLPAGVFDTVIGRSVDGTPLGLLLLQLAPDAQKRVADTLMYSIAASLTRRDALAAVSQESQATVAHALTVSRTEVMAAYRHCTDQAYQQSTIVQAWEWYAALNERTCAVCLAMHGSIHPLDEALESHPACRCTKIPVVPSWAQLGFSDIPDERPRLLSGPQAFAQMTRAQRLQIVGPGKLELLEAGTIGLPDLVVRTRSVRWGPGRREATLDELVPA